MGEVGPGRADDLVAQVAQPVLAHLLRDQGLVLVTCTRLRSSSETRTPCRSNADWWLTTARPPSRWYTALAVGTWSQAARSQVGIASIASPGCAYAPRVRCIHRPDATSLRRSASEYPAASASPRENHPPRRLVTTSSLVFMPQNMPLFCPPAAPHFRACGQRSMTGCFTAGVLQPASGETGRQRPRQGQ